MRSVTPLWRRRAVTAAVVLVVGATLYFAGCWQERERARGIQGALQQEVAGVSNERDRLRAEAAALQARLRLARARALLLETALDLDRRNFGIANTRLDAAAEELAGIENPTGVVDPATLQALRGDVAALDLRVAADLAEQRARVLDLAARLEGLVGAAPAAPGAGS